MTDQQPGFSDSGPRRVTVDVPGVGPCDAIVTDSQMRVNRQAVYTRKQLDEMAYPMPAAIFDTAIELTVTMTFVWPTDVGRVAHALGSTVTTSVEGLR